MGIIQWSYLELCLYRYASPHPPSSIIAVVSSTCQHAHVPPPSAVSDSHTPLLCVHC